jgi:hypothetical protein
MLTGVHVTFLHTVAFAQLARNNGGLDEIEARPYDRICFLIRS